MNEYLKCRLQALANIQIQLDMDRVKLDHDINKLEQCLDCTFLGVNKAALAEAILTKEEERAGVEARLSHADDLINQTMDDIERND